MSFEYHVISGIHITKLQSVLNRRADEQWELVAIIDAGTVTVVMKRSVADAPGEEAGSDIR